MGRLTRHPDAQRDLFEALPSPAPAASASSAALATGPAGVIKAATPAAHVVETAAALRAAFGERLFLGTSSWSFPGWRDLVWDGDYSESNLSRNGLAAYAAHPLMRTVSLDRTFYRAMNAAEFGQLASQVPDDFRFVVKVPSEVTDAVVRAPGGGAAVVDNPRFLDPRAALSLGVLPAVEGLGDKLGAVVFQISPLPAAWLRSQSAWHDRLAALWRAVTPVIPATALISIELRDSRLLTQRLIDQLAQHGVNYCVGVHDRMPPAARQFPAASAAGRGDLVCRWSLQAGMRYNQAKAQWSPFNRLQAADTETREALARAVVAVLNDGYRAFVTINNKAEGSAPLSVVMLAEAILRELKLAATPAPQLT